MKEHKNSYLSARGNSFRYAFEGLRYLLAEPNVKIHLVATITVIIASIVQQISYIQWIAIIICIVLVWVTEAINTCLEKLCDYASGKTIHPTIKIIKDIAAGAVLLSALASATIAFIIFIL